MGKRCSSFKQHHTIVEILVPYQHRNLKVYRTQFGASVVRFNWSITEHNSRNIQCHCFSKTLKFVVLPTNTYVPIGIGPVCLSVDYVYLGKPSEYLKDDMRFLAEKMNVIWQPLPVASKEEIKLFNEYMMQNPNHNNTA